MAVLSRVFRGLGARASLRSVAIGSLIVTLFGVVDGWASTQPSWQRSVVSTAAGLLCVGLARWTLVGASVAAGLGLVTSFHAFQQMPPSTFIAACTVLALAGASGVFQALFFAIICTLAFGFAAMELEGEMTISDRFQNALAFVLIGGGALFFRRTSDREVQLAEVRHALATELARTSLARDVHDITAYSLTTVLTQLRVARLRLDHREQEAALAALHQAETTTKEALADLRATTLTLSGSVATARPLQTVREVVAEVELASRRTPGCSFESTVSERSIQPAVATTAVRFVQQVLANSQSHAPGQPVFLHLSVEGDWLRLACRNAVEPVAVSSTGLGMGLAILKHRIEEVKGTFESSVEQGHFSVHCKLPLMV